MKKEIRQHLLTLQFSEETESLVFENSVSTSVAAQPTNGR